MDAFEVDDEQNGWNDIPTEILYDLQNQLRDTNSSEISFEEWGSHSGGAPFLPSFGSQSSLFGGGSSGSLFTPVGIKREESASNFENVHQGFSQNSTTTCSVTRSMTSDAQAALVMLNTTQEIRRPPEHPHVVQKRMSLRDLAREQAQRTPSEIVLDVTPLSLEDQQQLQKAKQITSQIQQLQQKQEQGINDVRTVQLQVLKAYDKPSVDRLNESITSTLKQIQVEIQRLVEIVKSLVLDAEALHTVRHLIQQLQIQTAQLELFQQELLQLDMPGPKVSVAKLVISEQPLPHVMFKGKVMDGAYNLNLITGANENFTNISDVQGVLVADGVNYKTKKPLENSISRLDGYQKQATFNNLKVNVSTRMTLVSIKFGLQVKSLDRVATVESPLSYPFIVITNESQWVEAASKLVMLDGFGGLPQVLWPQFANTLHSHFVSSTRQDTATPQRPLQHYELRFLHQKINGGVPAVTQQQATNFFAWFGNVERTIRFKRHVFNLWCQGYIFAFLSKEDAEKALAGQCVGAFLIRFSESQHGLFAIVYVSEDPEERIKHYLVRAEDIGSNKSLPDFLRESEPLQYLFKIEPSTNALVRMEKEVALKKFYSKRKLAKTKGYVNHIV